MYIKRLVDAHQLKSCINDSIMLIARSVHDQLMCEGQLSLAQRYLLIIQCATVSECKEICDC